MKSNLFIPSTIHVGFKQRSDSFDGKLSYVTYEDEKGALRKKVSWDGWRDTAIEPLVLENSPRSGYRVERSVQRYAGWSSSGRSMVRIYDDREFEFEITVENLVGILHYLSIVKGEIIGELIFAQAGSELVLLPIDCDEYQESLLHTNKQSMKLSAKDLLPGRTYEKKKTSEQFVYVGYYEWFDGVWDSGNIMLVNSTGKKHVFYDKDKKFITVSPSTLACEVGYYNEGITALIDTFFRTINSQKCLRIFDRPGPKIIPDGKTIFAIRKNNNIHEGVFSKNTPYNTPYIVEYKLSINGISKDYTSRHYSSLPSWSKLIDINDLENVETIEVCAELENGNIVNLLGLSL